jgi:dipeptidyl-peptidase-4
VLAGLLAGSVSGAFVPAAAATLEIDRLFDDPALSGPRARRVQVSPAGDRVAFLRGREGDQFQLDLWQVAITPGATAAAPRLLVDSKRLAPEEALSPEEKARRERERTASYHGIVDYHWSPDGRRLLVPLGGELYLVEIAEAGEPVVRHLALGRKGFLDPQLSPRGRYLSYVWRQNLYVYDLRTGRQRALTHDGGGNVHNGEAEFVAQEEFDQSSGYWWAPDDSSIVFKRVDESRVPLVHRLEIGAAGLESIELRYPAAGTSNAAVRLGIATPDAGAPPRWIDLGKADVYLPRIEWLPDARQVAVERLARDQKTLDLLFVDARSLRTRRILTETSATWLNVNKDLRFLQAPPGFVWGSEREGYHQLYLYDLEGRLQRALTHGDADVDEVLALDEAAHRLVFSSNRDRIEDLQLYTVDLADPGAEPRRLSVEDGWHHATFGCPAGGPAGCQPRLYVDEWSDANTPPQVSVRTVQGERLAWIEANPLDATHPYEPYLADHVAAQFGSLPAEDGQALHWRLLPPAHLKAGQRYPVLLEFYGGPTAQYATNAWPRLRFDEYLAQHGIGVFTLDNRGTPRRGRRFADPIYGALGRVEAADQLAGVRWLAQQPWVDAAHVGVFGWSYGGYLSLMVLEKAAGAVAAGVSVAPVTDWRLYDTAYTERYLGTPQGNPDGYRDSSVFAALSGLKSPLLLVHGMADDNVLFTNSTSLMAALQKQGTPFRLMTYPGGKHGLSTPAMQKHAFHAIDAFLRETLEPGAGP